MRGDCGAPPPSSHAIPADPAALLEGAREGPTGCALHSVKLPKEGALAWGLFSCAAAAAAAAAPAAAAAAAPAAAAASAASAAPAAAPAAAVPAAGGGAPSAGDCVRTTSSLVRAPSALPRLPASEAGCVMTWQGAVGAEGTHPVKHIGYYSSELPTLHCPCTAPALPTHLALTPTLAPAPRTVCRRCLLQPTPGPTHTLAPAPRTACQKGLLQPATGCRGLLKNPWSSVCCAPSRRNSEDTCSSKSDVTWRKGPDLRAFPGLAT